MTREGRAVALLRSSVKSPLILASCLFFILTTVFSLPLAATDLTGFWQSARTAPGGVKIDTFFTLRQHAPVLEGTVHFHWGDLEIHSGSVEGDKVRFQCGDTKAPMTYSGAVVADEMRLNLHESDPKIPDIQIVARRASSEAMRPGTPLPPPKLRELPSNGLAKTPPMGWNSWNFFHEQVDDATVRGIADTMVSSGMRDAGYIYLNIDDTWEGVRDAQGNITSNTKFPDMKALSDYVHSKGLKLGIYSSPGKTTCGGYEGSYGHEEQDARTFAAWGVDYLKYDWCSAFRLYKSSDMRAIYQKMGEALQKSGRPIVYSLCQYGMEKSWEWAPKVGGNLWRTTGDIADRWDSVDSIGFDQQLPLAKWAGPGQWNDPDMLEIGNGGMTADEYRTHMSLWSLLSAPLLAGNDLRSMSKETLSILTNREVIAVDQDAKGQQAQRAWKQGALEAWLKPMSDGSFAVGLFNRGDTAAPISIRWSELGVHGVAQVRDLWQHKQVTAASEGYTGQVPRHAVVLLRLFPKAK